MPVLATELSRLAQEGDVITVSNQQPGIVVFTDDNHKIQSIWEGKNDPSGKDVLECPATFLKSPKFRETILRGILAIEEAPEVLQNALHAQKAEWDLRQQRAANAEVEVAKANDRVIGTGVACIAPKGRGELCGSYSLVLGKNPNEHPPLCAEHQSLASQYVPSDTGRLDKYNRPEITWKRASLTRS